MFISFFTLFFPVFAMLIAIATDDNSSVALIRKYDAKIIIFFM